MSETEMTDEVDVEDEATANADSTEEGDTSSNEEEITYEQAKAWKQELESARKKIAHLSKEKKAEKKVENTDKKEVSTLDDETLDELLDKRDFYKNNTAAKSLKDDIESMYKASNGKFSRAELLAKLSGDDEIEDNRKVYAKSSVSGKQTSNDSFVAVDIARYDKMSGSEQKAYNEASKVKFGGVKFKE